MATLLTLPLELQEKITTYLLPPDAAVLSFTCRALNHHLGRDNQVFWYNLHRRSNPETITTLDPKVDYRSIAIDVFSGRIERICRICLKRYPSKIGVTFGDLDEQYCVPCHSDWFVEIEAFKNRFPEVQAPNPTLNPYLPRRSNHQPVIPITRAIRLVEKHHGTSYEFANSPQYRLRFRTTFLGIKKEAEFIHKALVFMRDIYKQQYRQLLPFLGPEEYCDTLADCFYDFIVKECPEPRNYLTPPRIVAKDIMEISRHLIGNFWTSRENSLNEATKLVNTVHRLLFGNPNKFDPKTLELPRTYVLIGRLRNFGNSGMLLYHMRHKYGPSDDNQNEILPNARCYWCLRTQKRENTENGIRTPPWIDPDDINRKVQPEVRFAVHILVHHPECMWKRAKGTNIFSGGCPAGEGKEIVSRWLGIVKTYRVLEAPLDIENEELEDIPEDLLPYRHRISNSGYMHRM
ncbi:hypothetical protein TWF281_007632 [Arthrobotrys megalospora]